MNRKTKKMLKTTFTRMTAMLLTILSVLLSASPIFATTPYPEAQGPLDG